MALLTAAILLSIAAVQQTTGQTCPVTQPMISTSVYCQSPTEITLNYTCNHPGSTVIWDSSVFSSNGELTIAVGNSNNPNVGLNTAVTGVMVAEMHSTDMSCINSTLTFTGSNLVSLDGTTLTCRLGGSDTVTISISVSDPPVLMSIPSTTCGSNGTHEVALQWSPPTNTGGQEIDHYLVTVTGSDGYTCPPDECNVTATNTTITGLECGSSYTVTVSAVNCIGESNSSQPMMFTATPELDPPQITLSSYTDNTLRVEWMSSPSTPCYSILGYSIVVSDEGGIVYQNDSIEGTQLTVGSLSAQGYLNVSLVTVTDCTNSSANISMLRISSPSPSPTPRPTCRPSNCASCSTPSCCRTCSSGYVISASDSCACVEVSTCPISNCTQCSDASGTCCRQCADGYTVSNCQCSTATPPRGGIQLEAGHISAIIVGVLLGLILISVLIALLLIGYHIGYRKKAHDNPKPTTRIITITPAQPTTEHKLVYNKPSLSSEQGSDEETVSIDFHKNE